MISTLIDFIIKQWECVIKNFTALQTHLLDRPWFNLQFPSCNSFKIFGGQIFFGCPGRISPSALCPLVQSAGFRLTEGNCWTEAHSFTDKKQHSLPSFHAVTSALHPSFRQAWVGGEWECQPLRTGPFARSLIENGVIAPLWNWKMTQ